MSLLAPLYILGALAISVPIILHLIRRTPRHRVQFSSLMFLSPSPPRVTRRSRIDNWLLLMLRGLAICLLALAFARPFLRDARSLDLDEAGRRIVLLVDVSASMRRGTLWSEAVAAAQAALDETRAADQVALFVFDDYVREVVRIAESVELPHADGLALVRDRLAAERPGWGGTDVGAALVVAANALESSRTGEAARAAEPGQIVLISDLQRGARREALAGYQWPGDIKLRVERVGPADPSNAGVLVIPSDASAGREVATGPGERRTRPARIFNEIGAWREEFSLSWEGVGGGDPARATDGVVVPSGESRVVRIPEPPQGPSGARLVLTGDAHDFDNSFYAVTPRRETVEVLYIGDDASADPAGLRYYLERALTGSYFDARLLARAPAGRLVEDAARPPRLIVVTRGVDEVVEKELRDYVESGGTVLHVVTRRSSARSAGSLLGVSGISSVEVEGGDYAMLTEIDFAHPMFTSMADPRFRDFTQIRFWRHRRVTWDTRGASDVRTLARFDGGDPAILETRRGRGRVLVFTSGWQPSDSQLALSTKFVPIVAGVLEGRAGSGVAKLHFEVNEPVPLGDPAAAAGPARVRTPGGEEVELGAGEEVFRGTDRPGIYSVETAGRRWSVAVNVAPRESRTSPLEAADLEREGVLLWRPPVSAMGQRQMLDEELEGSQKAWKWLLALVMVVLVVETWLAGRPARSIRASGTGGSDT